MNKPSFSSIAHPAKFLVFFFFALFGADLSAQSATLSVQGVLTKSDGTAVDDGQYPITFRLWTAESGGTMVHEETIQQVETTGGVYSVLLGQNGFQGTATFNQVYYLGVSVNGGAELAPRPRLTHAPYTLSVIGQNNKFTSTGPVEADGYKVNGGMPNAVVAGTGYSFRGNGSNSDQDGGLFSYADDHVGLFTNNQERIKVTGGLIELKSTNTNTNNLFTYGRASSNDGFGYHSNGAAFSTGLFFNNSATASIWTNGVERFNAWNNGSNYYKAPNGGHIFETGYVQVDNTLSVSGTTNLNGTNNLNGTSNLNSTTNLNGTVSTTGSKITVNKPIEITTGNEVNFLNNNNPPLAGFFSSSGVIAPVVIQQIPALLNINGITMGNFFYAVSDRRIKKDFTRVSLAESLAKLQKLQVTSYRYIDEIAKGRGLKKGFIAQEVEQIEPEAINLSVGFIPSVYMPAEKVHIAGQHAVVSMSKPHGLQKGEKVRIYDGSQQHDLEVLTATETEFTVSKWSETAEKGAFVYGKEVNDFRAVEYDYIFTMNVAATQELARQVEELKNENAALRSKLENQSATIGELARRMTALENAGSTTGTRK